MNERMLGVEELGTPEPGVEGARICNLCVGGEPAVEALDISELIVEGARACCWTVVCGPHCRASEPEVEALDTAKERARACHGPCHM